MNSGRLYLIPSWLDEQNSTQQFPATTLDATHRLTHFIVERAKTARHFLKQVGYPHHFDDVWMGELNKHAEDDASALLGPCLEGHDVGLLSEAGVPGVADPGGAIVHRAHELGIDVVPLIGPSSLLLALMGSGMNGQRFTFHGYLAKDERDLTRQLKEMEQDSRQHDTTHLFIETPYRNDRMMKSMLQCLHADTRIGLAIALTSSDEVVRTKRVADWRKSTIEIGRKPAVFLLFSGKIKG